MVQAIGKTIAGGVSDDFTSVGYHDLSAGDWIYEPIAPIARHNKTGMV